jgi:Ni/Fe-hydrogenase subunit HybB-like protein
MRKVIATVLSILAFGVAAFFIYPAVFGLVSGLFENNDVGAAVGIVVCLLITGPLLFVGLAAGAFALAFAAVLDDEAGRKRYKRS